MTWILRCLQTKSEALLFLWRKSYLGVGSAILPSLVPSKYCGWLPIRGSGTALHSIPFDWQHSRCHQKATIQYSKSMEQTKSVSVRAASCCARLRFSAFTHLEARLLPSKHSRGYTTAV